MSTNRSGKYVPEYEGTLRSHRVDIPACIR